MAHFERKSIGVMAALALLLTFVIPLPSQAGDPDKTIGGINPNHYVCVNDKGEIIDLDNDAISGGDGDNVSFDLEKTIDLNKLEEECDDADNESEGDFDLELIRRSRLEGFVVEFHADPGAPGGWRGVFSRDVPVFITGPGFEVFKGSDKDGSFYFDNLGAGPATFNLRLPPDAHPTNPNVTVVTDGLPNTTSGIYLGFYRGDVPPPDVSALTGPDGVPLPLANYTYDESIESATDPFSGEVSGMPSVGGVLPRQISLVSVVLAVVLVIVLPAVGVLKARRNNNENQE
ncbi:MAG: hypothetical protein HS126_19315 [Anaerolineales bacterium]|nr:hypothetical protein [Anaerolineales bacterium]